jgi:hypothetical protein
MWRRIGHDLLVLVLGLVLVALVCIELVDVLTTTPEERVQRHYAALADDIAARAAKSLRGQEIAAGNAGDTVAVVERAATDAGPVPRAVRVLRSGDDGRATWVELMLRTPYQGSEDPSWHVLQLDVSYDVSGCVRYSVRHGQATWQDDAAARLQVSAMRCPPDTPLPDLPEYAQAGPEAIAYRVTHLPRISYRIRPRPPACYSPGNGYCPGG